jgi:hypothetical protein
VAVRWYDGGNRATISYDTWGLPSRAPSRVGVYGYSIGFVPQFVDPYLGAGGVLLDGSSFIDVEMSTVGVPNIGSATLALYGRSYSVSSSAGFEWLSFSDSGSTPSAFVSNVAPYRWYAADLGSSVAPGDAGVRLRIRAAGGSGAIVVNRLEICIRER